MRTVVIKGEARRAAILAAAWDSFLERGYAGSSMDEITRRAGGSKMSVYAHFESKQALFETVVRQRAELMAARLDPPARVEGDARLVLEQLAGIVLDAMESPDIQSLHRVALADRRQFPELGELLYRHGTQRFTDALAGYLEALMAAGKLRSDDPRAAAEALLGLLLGTSYLRFALGISEPAAPRDEKIGRAVRTFLTGYSCTSRPEPDQALA